MIQTQYEINGDWSSSEFGQNFMVDLSADSGVPLFSIGQAHLGSEIYGMEFGAGDKILIITGGVHRSEPASREMVMMKTRDMAYNLNGKYDEIFQSYTIYSIPTVNPETTYRNNAQGLNINRDAYSLETTEMPLLMKFINEKNPGAYIDFHERGGTFRGEQVEFIDTMKISPNATRENVIANDSMVMYSRNELEEKGYVTAPYPQSIIGPGMTVSASSLLGVASMTPETHIDTPDTQYRLNALGEVFESVLRWYNEHVNVVEKLKDKFRTSPVLPYDDFYLINGDNEYYENATIRSIKVPEGYVIDENEDFSKWIDTYDIQIDENRFVPIEQKSGLLLPHLLDPESDMAVVSATRVEPPEPEKRTDGRYTKVKYDDWEEVFIKNYL